ncbi:hypothetical protein V757_12505 [Pelistega indica]|uniref:Uncharacterized protein n=1 Tax=Pelistega indica TaxID=1414851 RepID=V8FS68_9BURK|nr:MULTISPECIES: hypothetical protein [Pelistega]ETD66538.1 hypothetical protein V757_12505 [Pelistega indica]
MLKKTIITLILSLPLSVWAQPKGGAIAQQELIQALNAFANASCLAEQKDSYLKKTGEAWANSLMEGNSEFNPEEVLIPLSETVDKAIANTTAYVIRYEASPTGDLELPIAYCFDVIHQPNVQALIRELSKKYSRLGKKPN